MNSTIKTALHGLAITFLLVGLSIPKTSLLIDLTLMTALCAVFISMLLSSKKS